MTYTRVGLDLVRQNDSDVKLFGNLLQTGEELVEFLEVRK
jgi:hypothetical protein